jgi:hypothetical protein
MQRAGQNVKRFDYQREGFGSGRVAAGHGRLL